MRYIRQSSANNLTVLWMSVARSLMYSRNKTDPRTGSCGTSEVTSHGDEDMPLTTTLCTQLLKRFPLYVKEF